jgi:4-diphosphocytidyl-2-C-methyl-D-erythritol kinase
MQDLVLPAPAKLNLFLHITGRRADGYHELETLFQFLDFADEVHLSLRDDGIIEQGQALEGVPREDDLTIRAAELLQQKLGTHLGVRIDIHKRLPLGGGLGGGSSDAATTLLGLNRLWQGGLNLDQLADLGLALGADVPVFIHGHSALAKGVGEQLWPADPPCYWYLVLIPPLNVSTKEIFSLSALTRNSAPLKIPGFVQGIADPSFGNAFWAQTRNDCQSVVSERYHGVQQALDWLEEQDTVWPGGRLTGTGACVFAAFAQKSTAERALSNCPTELGGFIAQGINISPVHDQLGEM